jgi:WD40 repeat protein
MSGERTRTSRRQSRDSGSVVRFLLHRNGVEEIALGPQYGQYATSCNDGIVRLWDIHSRRIVGAIEHNASQLVFSPDGRRIEIM